MRSYCIGRKSPSTHARSRRFVWFVAPSARKLRRAGNRKVKTPRRPEGLVVGRTNGSLPCGERVALLCAVLVLRLTARSPRSGRRVVRGHVGGPHKNCRVTRAHSFLLPSFHSPRCFPLLLSFFSSQIYNLLARADATMECGAGALLLAACSWSGTSSLALRGGCGAARARRDGAEPSGEAARGGLPAVSSARGTATCSLASPSAAAAGTCPSGRQ